MMPGRVVVTGASSGIGRELALELARQGADLVITARREERLDDLAEQITAIGRQAVVVAGDVTDSQDRMRIVERAVSQLGGLDILVNNAGVTAHGRFVDASPERLRQVMEVNFFAAAELIRLAVPVMQGGHRPTVVNIGSILGRRGIPWNSEYCASKFALSGLSESLRAELAPLGIHVLAVHPGPTDTELFEHLVDSREELPWRRGHVARASVVAKAIVRAIRRGKREIVPSGRGRLLLWANRVAPGMVDRWLARYG